MVEIDGQWTLNVDYRHYEKALVRAMPQKPARLTGSEVKFIRLHFGMTLERFAARFGLTRQAVMKWEKAGNATTSMAWSTEKDIRLFILDRKGVATSRFRAAYAALVEIPSSETKEIIIRRPKTLTGARRSVPSFA
jgi:transcriptional regulator with XRE-family HTH domain